MKRKAVVTIIFVVIMMMLLQSSAFALTYSDVATSHWSYVPIDRVTDLGFMSGTSSTVFGRNVELTRKEAAKIFTLAAKEMWRNEEVTFEEDFASVGTNTGFTDVSSSSSYAQYVSWVKEKGIMSGVSDTAFSPNVTINRQEICVSLYKLKQFLTTPFETVEYDYYNDHDEISSWASAGVYAITRFGVVSGDNYGNFNPKDPIVRQEMAAIMYSFWNLSRYKKNVTTPVADDILAAIAAKENDYSCYSNLAINYTDNINAILNVSATAYAAAKAAGYDVAADMLLHYLGRSGNKYTVPLSEMMNGTTTLQYKTYKDEVNDYRKAVETYINGNISIALRDEIYADEDNHTGNDWKYAINKCRYASQITATISSSAITATAYYELRDFYDYEGSEHGFINILASDLNFLHQLGYAKCYHVGGSINTGS